MGWAPSQRLAIIGCGAVIEQRYVPVLKIFNWALSTLIDISRARCLVVRGPDEIEYWTTDWGALRWMPVCGCSGHLD
jgi:hypothetical protein